MHALDSIYPRTNKVAHGVEVPAGVRYMLTSGQVDTRPDGTTAQSAAGQSEEIFRRLESVLEAAGKSFADVVRFNADFTDRAYRDEFFAVRDRIMGDLTPRAA
ncbi:MAG: RidA family protein, partial [Burkholderiales bacterium]|nr:RidA family protein [Burkholderiales bacterium]